MELTDGHGADVVVDMVGGRGHRDDLDVRGPGRPLRAGGFNDDPESGLTGRPLRKVSMGNFSVLGVMMGYTEMPVEFRALRHQHLPAGRPGATVHAALRELVAAGAIRPVVGRVITMEDVAAALDDHDHRRTSGRTVVAVTSRVSEHRDG